MHRYYYKVSHTAKIVLQIGNLTLLFSILHKYVMLDIITIFTRNTLLSLGKTVVRI